MSQVLTVALQLANDQGEAWQTDADTAPLFLSLVAMLFVFGLVVFIRNVMIWRTEE